MDNEKNIEIPFGASDSELHECEYTIPEGYEAKIEDGKVIVRKADSEGERIRKDLLNHLYAGANNKTIIADANDYKKWANWLEKQGKKKPVEYTLEQATGIFLDALSKTPYNNKPITDAQVIARELLNFLSNANSYNPNALVDQNSAWSEEDETHRHWILEMLKAGEIKTPEFADHFRSAFNWLKSLRPQKQWKPSEEQMGVIEAVINNRSFQKRHLDSLYADLKKLK